LLGHLDSIFDTFVVHLAAPHSPPIPHSAAIQFRFVWPNCSSVDLQQPSQSPVEGQRVGKGFRGSVIRVEIFAAINDRDEQEIICRISARPPTKNQAPELYPRGPISYGVRCTSHRAAIVV
jgi:hypothetical protein